METVKAKWHHTLSMGADCGGGWRGSSPSQPDPETPVQISSSCLPKTGGGGSFSRDDLFSAAEHRWSWYPAPAEAGAAFLPHALKHRWASDLGIEAHASWWL